MVVSAISWKLIQSVVLVNTVINAAAAAARLLYLKEIMI